MSGNFGRLDDESSGSGSALSCDTQIDLMCDEFEQSWRQGSRPRIEEYLGDLYGDRRKAAFRELLEIELIHRTKRGESKLRHEYLQRFPDYCSLIDKVIGRLEAGGPLLPADLGYYEVIEKIGEGGMGVVLKARDRTLGTIVAIKILSQVRVNREALERFDRELKVLSQLDHPNIVRAVDQGLTAGVPYLVLEYVDGIDLRQQVKTRGPLPINQARDCLLQAAEGLDYAHDKGIVHRDIKPGNLLLDKHGVLKILDLGLARRENDGSSWSRLTQSGQMLGTSEFMAPEQAQNPRLADPRSDIYSLGCTLHYLLMGRPPYRGRNAAVTLVQHREAPVPSLQSRRADVPESLDKVFQKMLAKDPQQRYQSMAELVAALEGREFTPKPPRPAVTRWGAIETPPELKSPPGLENWLRGMVRRVFRKGPNS